MSEEIGKESESKQNCQYKTITMTTIIIIHKFKQGQNKNRGQQ